MFGFFGIEECISATKCKPTPTTPTTTHPTLLHTISLTRAHSTSAACAAETQDNEEHSNAYTTEPPTGVTTAAGGQPSHPHPIHCAVPRYGLLGPTPPTKAFIRPHQPHSLTPAATAAAKQAEAAVHHNPTITGHSQQHPPVPSIPTIPAESLQDEAEAPTEPQHPEPPPHRHQTSPTEQTTTAGPTRHEATTAHQSTLVQNPHCPTQQEGQNQTRRSDYNTAPPSRSFLEHHRIA